MFNVLAIVVFRNHTKDTMEHPVVCDYLFGPDDVSRRPLNLILDVPRGSDRRTWEIQYFQK